MALEPDGQMAKGRRPYSSMSPKSLWSTTPWAHGPAYKLYQSWGCASYIDSLKMALFKPFLKQVLLILLLVR